VISNAGLVLQTLRWRSVLIWACVASCVPVRALNPNYTLLQYVHTSWGSDSGLLTVNRITQTSDGYLWLATSGGLVRFDGVRFTTYTAATEQSLVSSTITELAADPDGSLWAAALFGGVVAHYQAGKFHAYTSRDGLPSAYIQSLYRDSRGVLWVGTRGAGIFRMAHGRFEKVSLGIPATAIIRTFLEDSEQSLWIATYGNGVFRFQNGSIRGFSAKDGLPDARLAGLCRDRDGTIWTAGWSGVSSWNGTRFLSHPEINSRLMDAVACAGDRDGNLWVASTSGLIRARAGKVVRMDASSGLSADLIQHVYEDREGNIWVATSGGLDRLRDAQVRTFTRSDGFFHDSAVQKGPLIADGTAGVWTVFGNQIARIAGSKVTVWPNALPAGSRSYTTLSEPDSGLLVGFDRGLKHWNPAQAAFPPEMTGLDIRSMLQAHDRSVWIGTANRGLLHWKSYPGLQTLVETGVPDKSIATLAEDPDGAIWAGSQVSGLYRIAGQRVQHFGQGEGLRSPDVNTVFVDREGKLWIGSASGLSWIQGGRILTVSSQQGMESDPVYAILDDSYDRLWLLGYGTIAALEKKSLTEWAAGGRRLLNPTFYRSAHGLPIYNLVRTFPNAARSTDGHFWFALGDGFAEVTPPNPGMHSPSFLVLIEDVTIDHVAHSESGHIHMAPGSRSIDLRYTALTLSNSKTVRFRYRLDGHDDDWVDADTRRLASYTDLKPGTYKFRVAASAGEEQWQESSALVLEQMPFFYQTWWFMSLASAAALSLAFLAYRLRVHQITREFNVRLDERVGERTRLARDLHDTLLQSFQGSLFEFQAGRNLLSRRPEEAAHTLDDAICSAEAAIAEGRYAIQGLRSGSTVGRDLAHLFSAVFRELSDTQASNGNSPEFRVTVEGTPRALPAVLQDELYRIGREVLRNAFRHARAKRIEVEVRYSADEFRLRIRDDGIGIDPKVLNSGARPGHWGLPGVRERAKLAGARLDFWSEAGAGTEVQIKVPAAAYATPRRTDLFKFFRKKITIHAD
jgi:signal transduction histidine kinase/ligand-binding sensor domain-containing protein